LSFGALELKSNKGSSKGSGGSSSGGKWSSSPMNNGWLHAANANISIAAERLQYETWDIAKPSLSIVMQNGVLDIKNLKGGLFGGQVAMQSNISSSSASAPLSVSTGATMSNVNIEKLAAALSSAKRLQGSGNVSLSMTVAGSGASQKALVSSLNGSANLDGANIIINGFDLEAVTNAVANDNRESILGAVKSLNSGSTRFDTLKGVYKIDAGVVSIESMAMDGAVASLTSTGSASLPSWQMDTKHKVSFNQSDKLDPFTFEIRGPINKPISTLTNIGSDILKAQAGKFVQELIQDKLSGTSIGDKLQQFGILPKAETKQPAPANDSGTAGDTAQPIQEQAQEQPKSVEDELKGVAEEALGNVLKGLF